MTNPAISADAFPLDIHSPSAMKPGERRPFVLLLHGFGADGKTVLSILGIDALAEQKRFLYAAPDGEKSRDGKRFWNAGAACCNLSEAPVDHVARVRAWVAAAQKHPNVDPRRIFLVGFSNGGFMAHRAACEVAGIAAIASLAGAGPVEPCHPPAPVAVLEVHGDADEVVRYQGGRVLNQPQFLAHGSALETVRAWAERNGCKGAGVPAGTLDLDGKLPGEETERIRFLQGTRPVELWTVHGGSHFVTLGPQTQALIFDFLLQTVKP